MSSDGSYKFEKSNFILIIGGQILLLVLVLMVAFFGSSPLTFPAQAVRNMISKQTKIS
jgi:hypothetical protein